MGAPGKRSLLWSSGVAPAQPVDLGGEALSVEDKNRLLSARRLRLTLSVFVVALMLVMSGVVYFGVSRIFDWLTPTIRHDLERKARRGAIELAQTTQIGIVVGDAHVISDATGDYLEDADVIGLLVVDGQGSELFSHGAAAARSRDVLGMRPLVVHEDDEAFTAWAPSTIEGANVGRVAITLSKSRLEAGLKLRRDVLAAGAGSCVVALVVCLLFVNLYIGPILRFTGDVIRRLERTTEAALTAARAKSQFLANMSHEIRTPMNGIVGVLDLMRRTPLTAKQQRYAETMESSARSLLTIIDDILDFSKLEAGKYALRSEAFVVRQQAQDVVELLAPRAHAKELELVLRVDAAVPHSVQGDADRIKQVLTNLVGNAIKFTEKGHVLLRIDVGERTAAGVRLRYSVTDTGVGIAHEDLDKLFSVFSQIDDSMTRRFGGTGLGLAISRRLVEGMGGTIGVDSQLGCGSTFWFELDLREGALPAGPALLRHDARVLLVSADEAQRETMWELMSAWGMSCVAADGAEEAAARLVDSDSLPFDVAVVDGSFEVKEGFGLLDLCVTEGVPVVRLISSVQTRIDQSGGFHRIGLIKPVRVSELYNGIVSLVDGKPFESPARTALDHVVEPLEPRPLRQIDPVLVVDDNEINRIVAVEMLLDLGYMAEVACDGREAVEKASSSRYAAVLMDCQMPNMDGYEATRRIRQLPPPTGRVPIIALTAHAMVGDKQKVLDAGMDDYTSKPVRARALALVLARWIGPSEPKTSAPEEAPVEPLAADTSASADVPDLDRALQRSPRAVAVFCDLTPSLIAEIEAAADASDLERLRRAGHKLKGSCLSIGTARLAAAAHAIEQSAHAGTVDASRVEQLAGLYERARVALTESTSLEREARS